ncbi:MAG TPA: MATE family efflux transporter [Candidatus Wallbacteria bacterium]|nr:MATE family efflux transporter [Candidatus Wallbacteria bacterium]
MTRVIDIIRERFGITGTKEGCGSGDAWRVLLMLAVPSMLSMFFQNFYAIMDKVFVSLVSTKALAAMSICIPVFFVTLSAAALFISCPHAVLAVFKPELDVLELGSYVISVSAMGYFMVPFELTLFGIAQGLKHPGYVFFINLFRFILARISFAYVLSSRWGVNGVYWSHPCSMVLSGLISLFILWHLIVATRKKMAVIIQPAV